MTASPRVANLENTAIERGVTVLIGTFLFP